MMKSLILIIIAFLFSCKSSTVPEKYLQPYAMEKIEKDLMKVDEFISNYLMRDSSLNIKKERSILYDKVFLLHQTNRQLFFASYKFYQQHPDLQKKVFDSLYTDLNSRKEDTVLIGPGRKRPVMPKLVK